MQKSTLGLRARSPRCPIIGNPFFGPALGIPNGIYCESFFVCRRVCTDARLINIWPPRQRQPSRSSMRGFPASKPSPPSQGYPHTPSHILVRSFIADKPRESCLELLKVLSQRFMLSTPSFASSPSLLAIPPLVLCSCLFLFESIQTPMTPANDQIMSQIVNTNMQLATSNGRWVERGALEEARVGKASG
jgi:hypothetical protein